VVAIVDPRKNLFVKPLLQSMHSIERDIVRLYAESCYTNIQAAHGNLSCMERMEQLADALCAAERRWYALRARLRRIGVPKFAISGLDERQRLALFEAEFNRHDPAFATQHAAFDRQQLCNMLEDIANMESAD
jgi:hypothetical protein